MFSIFQYDSHSYAQHISSTFGRGHRHAIKVYTEWFRHGSVEGIWEKIEPQAQVLVKKIIEITDFTLPVAQSVQEEGGAKKILLTLQDGQRIESVIIAMKSGSTLCVSSQVGCQMGCTFCQTGRMGLVRHLDRGEIVAQVFYARYVLYQPIKNIVFMGMGEPLDNYREVMGAVKILTDAKGWGFGPSRMTISTSGRVDGIYQLIAEADPALNLAVSVNAPNDRIRQKIMPVNRKWNMEVLRQAMAAYCAHPRRTILVEYVLLKGINDGIEHADELVSYLQGLRVTVNLIPYNPGLTSSLRYEAPTMTHCRCFLERIREKGYMATLRGEKGQQMMAACGQLFVAKSAGMQYSPAGLTVKGRI